jgi:hypothetical protein
MPETPTVGVGGKLSDPDWLRERASKAGKSRTTPDYHLARITEIVERTRAEQGLPPVVVDELTLANVAALVRSSKESAVARDAA